MSSKKLDALIVEAKSEQPAAVRDLDWSKMEASLMARVEAEAPESGRQSVAKVSPLRSPEWRKKYLRPATIALALAASVVMYARRHAGENPTAEHTEQHAQNVLAQRDEASSLTSGDLLIDDAPLVKGQVVRAGDALSIKSGRANLERGKAVSWLMETNDGEVARARVSSAGQQGDGPAKPLVLDLEHGAIEAQVTPVSAGEAFAVDVITKKGIVRVAVHGTHLRVSRAGDRVIVDLTEGVIAIGAPPSQGLTTGTTVTAPAHIELDATDLGSLKVAHTDVRAPVQLGEHVVVLAPAPAETEPAPITLVPTPSPKPAPEVEAPKVVIAPRDAIINAVRECATKHAPSTHASEVRVSVTSSLELTVGADGMPTLAKFTPPLQAEVQTCAAETIYKTKLDETGKVNVPISFSY